MADGKEGNPFRDGCREENSVAMKERMIRQQFLFGRLLLLSRHDVMEGNQIISVVGFHLKDTGTHL